MAPPVQEDNNDNELPETPGECAWGELVDGVCVPEPPRGTPEEECPSGSFGPEGICTPQAPAAPVLQDWDCPEGWFAETAYHAEHEGLPNLRTCTPPDSPRQCAPGQRPTLTSTACEPHGPACPTEGELWPSENALRAQAPGFEGRLLYVAADADPDGEGTRDAPLDLTEALSQIAEGDILALAVGTFTTPLRIDLPVAVVGACVADTQIEPVEAGPEASLELHGAEGVLVSTLSIKGVRPGARLLGGGARLVDVRFEGTQGAGILVGEAAQVDLERVVVLETRFSDPQDGALRGQGLGVEGAAQVSAVDSVFSGNQGIGIWTKGEGTALDLEDVLVTDTFPRNTFAPGLTVGGGASLTGRRLLVRRAMGVGIQVYEPGTQVHLEDLAVVDTKATEPGGDFGRGLDVTEGARVEVVRGSFLRNLDRALMAFDPGTELILSDIFVADTGPTPFDDNFGTGLGVDLEAHVVVQRAVFTRNHTLGLWVSTEGSLLEISDVIIADTRAQPADGQFGEGITILDGGEVRGRGLALVGNRSTGIHIEGQASLLSLEDTRIQDTIAGPDSGGNGRGMMIQDGAGATCARCLVAQNIHAGIVVIGAGSRLEAFDLEILETQADPILGGIYGRGLDVSDGAALDLTRALLTRNHQLGIYILDGQTSATLRDVVVRETRPQPGDDLDGIGLAVQSTPEVTMLRTAFVKNTALGVLVSLPGASILATDLTITDTSSGERDGEFGRGLNVQSRASATVTRGLFERNRDYSVLALDEGSSLDLTDIRIDATAPAACLDTTCPDFAAGTGLLVDLGALSIKHFLITGSDLAGVQIVQDPDVRFEKGILTGNTIGANIQFPELDYNTAFIDVQAYDNAVDIDTQDLPIPSASEHLENLEDL